LSKGNKNYSCSSEEVPLDCFLEVPFDFSEVEVSDCFLEPGCCEEEELPDCLLEEPLDCLLLESVDFLEEESLDCSFLFEFDVVDILFLFKLLINNYKAKVSSFNCKSLTFQLISIT
jgi:hypothetical protein